MKKKTRKTQKRTVPKNDQKAADSAMIMRAATEQFLSGNVAAAQEMCELIVQANDDYAPAHHLLGKIYHKQTKRDKALSHFDIAVKKLPHDANAVCDRAAVLIELDRLDDALEDYRRAGQIDSSLPFLFENIASLLLKAGQPIQAELACLTAIQKNSNSIAFYNLGVIYNYLGRYSDALIAFEKAKTLDPAKAEIHLFLAHTHLRRGEYEYGWKEMHWANYLESANTFMRPRIVPFPKWSGESLHEKCLLIESDQGVGDEVMCASVFAELIHDARRLIIECPPRLYSLFKRSFPDAYVISFRNIQQFSWSAELGKVDYSATGMEACRFKRRSSGDFPTPCRRYLTPDPVAMENISSELSEYPGKLKIGVSWRGGVGGEDQVARSLDIEDLRPLGKLENAIFINLQHGHVDQELQLLKKKYGLSIIKTRNGDPNASIDNLAALIASLDLVLTVDNTNAHLAGALGTPAWVLLPPGSNWRWLEDGSDTFWYQSVRLIRNRKPGSKHWKQVIEQVVHELSDPTETVRHSHQVPHTDRSECTASDSTPVATTPLGSPNSTGDSAAPALLINDTTIWLHWGFSCSSLAVHYHLRKHHQKVISLPFHQLIATTSIHPKCLDDFDSDEFWLAIRNTRLDIISQIEKAGAVYVNGISDIISKSDHVLLLLYIIYITKIRLNKPIFILNHSSYPVREGHPDAEELAKILLRKVFSEVDYVYARDDATLEKLDNLNLRPVPSFDPLPLYIRDVYEPRSIEREAEVVISGLDDFGRDFFDQLQNYLTTLVADGGSIQILIGSRRFIPKNDLSCLSALKDCIAAGVEVIDATSETEWLTTIRNAKVLVSSGFHHCVAATSFDVPTILIKRGGAPLHPLIAESQMVTKIDAAAPGSVAKMKEAITYFIAVERNVSYSGDSFYKMCAAAERSFSCIRAKGPEAAPSA
jgi:Tfp pilus assembly protein PilF